MRNLTNARDAVKQFEDSLNSAQFNESQKIKPITDEELTAAIRQHIAQRKAKRNKRTSGKQLIVNPDRIENSQQCQATTRYGIRCKNYTRRSAYCQPHLMQLRNLRIGKSNITDAELGLFSARKPIPRVSFTTEYKGTESSNPIRGNYVLQVGNGSMQIDQSTLVVLQMTVAQPIGVRINVRATTLNLVITGALAKQIL